MATQLTILPCISQPKKDELLSSWLYRLAGLNFTKAHTFCKFHFGNLAIWNRDIDRSATDPLLHKISLITTTPLDRIRDTLLTSYEGKLFEYFNPIGNQKWIAPLGIYHRKRKSFGLQFCPQCLTEDGQQPYFRKSWRLSISVACIKCKILLHDRCPFCGSTICFFRNEIGYKYSYATNPITFCYVCKNDLRKSPRYPSRIGTIAFQMKANLIIKNGYSPRHQYSIQYFLVLYQTIKLLTYRKKKYNRFQELLMEIKNNNIFKKSNYQKVVFDNLSTVEREQLLIPAMWVLENWPKRFIAACTEANLSRAYISFDFKYIPFWFAKILDHSLRHDTMVSVE